MAGFGSMAPSIYYDPMTGLPINPEPDPSAVPTIEPQGKLSRIFGALTGTNPGQPRVQTWPERLVRSAVTLPGDVMSGEQPMLPPGLRREDYTDAPAPSGPTEDSTWLGRALGTPPVAAQPNDPAYERAQDLAGLAGGGMIFGRLAPSAGEVAAAAATPKPVAVPPRPAASLLADSATPGAPISALEHAPKFYSGLERAVEAIPQPRMTGEQWLGTLNNRGVKPEEMDWTRLRGFLSEKGSAPVTKAEVQTHLADNGVKLGEVNKGHLDSVEENPRWQRLMAANNALSHEHELPDVTPERRASIVDDMNANHDLMREIESQSEPTKFQGYQLPGGENYREKLLTLPRNRFGEQDLPQGWRVEPTPHSTGNSFRVMADGESSPMGYGETQQSAIEQALAENGINPKAQSWYKSSHWDEPNVLVHRRTNERDINGQRSLHIEEIQSDWHQQGRKSGYDDPVARAAAEKKLNDAGYPISGEDARGAAEDGILTAEEAATIGNRSYIPNAPFKKNWHELALKDAIREAAEKGIDRISWTPGEAQAARYDLSKTVQTVVYKDGKLTAIGPTGQHIMNEQVVPKEKLPNYIGKDAAEKLLKQEPHNGAHTLRGEELKVGGEGMKGFYDKMIPDALNKIGKPHGVKVQSGTARIHPSYWADGPHEPVHRPEQHAPVHYMDIPQSLKDQALKKGFSLFEDSAAVGSPLAASYHDLLDKPRDEP